MAAATVEQRLDSSLDQLVETAQVDGAASGTKRQRGGGGQGGAKAELNRRLYVGNLSWNVTWGTLKDHFRSAGNVLYADVLRDREGRSKGCGIVEFETIEEAATAVSTLDRSTLDGREMFVREDREPPGERREPQGQAAAGPPAGQAGAPAAPGTAKKRRDRDRGRGRGAGGPAVEAVTAADGEQPSPVDAIPVGRRLYVNNLSFDTTWASLKDHFRSAGNVLYADVLMNGESSKGCGIVEFEQPEEALRAISMLSNSMLDGRAITVREDREDWSVKGSGGQDRGGRGRGSAPRTPVGNGEGAATTSDKSGRQVVVHGLPYSMEWQDLKDLVKPYSSSTVRVDIAKGYDGRSRGYGTVLFDTADDASSCIKALNGAQHDSRVLLVKLDKYA